MCIEMLEVTSYLTTRVTSNSKTILSEMFDFETFDIIRKVIPFSRIWTFESTRGGGKVVIAQYNLATAGGNTHLKVVSH